MPYFLCDQNLSAGLTAEVVGDEARHILVHRPKIGEEIKLQGPDGKRYLCKIVEVKKTHLLAKADKEILPPKEPDLKITLFQSVVSEKALDFIFQKGTELGVSKIILFNSQNTAVKLSGDKFKSKQERWNKILIESAKQCERGVWPELEFLLDVDQVLSSAKIFDKVFLADISGQPINHFNRDQSWSILSIIIGPEGGFTQEELSKFKSLSNAEVVSLGPILLRAETASLASLAKMLN